MRFLLASLRLVRLFPASATHSGGDTSRWPRSLSLLALVAGLLVAVLPTVAPPAARAQSNAPPAQLEVTKITPSVVGPGAPPMLTVSGRLTNTSGRQLNNVEARVERGAPVDNEGSVRSAMGGDTPTVTEPNFMPVGDTLAPGAQLPFDLRIPLNGGTNSLRMTQPGTYPVLVNVNAETGAGSRARVGESQFLLPVLAPPGAPPAPPQRPTPTTMLFPIVDYPRMEREAAPGRQTLLVDDQLSASLAPGGRLYDLVQAVGEGAGPGSPLGSSLCFAIDPDLLATANAMQNGYQVRQPDGSIQPGIGAGAARLWLSKLRQVTSGRCVIPLPYADADVTALARGGLPDVVKGAMDGSALIKGILGVDPRTDVQWPIDGAVDEPTARQLSRLGVRTFLTQQSSVSAPPGRLDPVRLNIAGAPTAQPIDPLLSHALDPLMDTERRTTALSPPAEGSLSAQNALGGLAARATTSSTNGTSVLAPPRRWNMRADDVRALLSGMEQLTRAGYIRPTGLASEQSGTGQDQGSPEPTRTTPPANLEYPEASARTEITQPVLAKLAGQNFKVGDLFRSSQRAPETNIDPGQVTTPLRNGLLRGASSAWRGNPDGASDWVRRAANSLANVLSGVQLQDFRGQITLTSSNAPIPLSVTNRLPMTVEIVLRVPRTAGIQPKDLGVLRVPAQGRRQFHLETEVHRTGKFNVDVQVQTPEGTKLGSPKRVQLESYAYSPFTVILTSIAGVLLAVLSARRIIRRVRARSKRSDAAGEAGPETRSDPEPDAGPGGNATADTAPQSQITTTESDRGTS